MKPIILAASAFFAGVGSGIGLWEWLNRDLRKQIDEDKKLVVGLAQRIDSLQKQVSVLEGKPKRKLNLVPSKHKK